MIDLDLLLSGVVLHDIGKIYELSYERGFGYTTEGQLLGHISIAMRMVSDKLAGMPDFSAALADAGGAHDPQPSRASGIRIPQGASISRGDAAALPRRSGFEMECMRVLVDRTVWWRVTSPATAHPWSAQF